MQITVTGRHVDISDAFKTSIEEGIHEFVTRYNLTPVDMTVTLSKHGHQFHIDINSHIGRGVNMRAQGSGSDAYTCFTTALGTLTGRLRKFKKRLVDHHKHRDTHVTSEQINHYVLNGQALDHDENEDLAPAIIAEVANEISTLSVGDAVMRMDLSSENTFMFRNLNTGRINVVYQKSDGNIGWIDPQQ